MELIRDCLDKQLVDRHGRNMGKVDGIVMEIETGRQPRIACIEVGPITRAYRLHPTWGRTVTRFAKRLSASRKDRYRIPWGKVVVTGTTVTAGVDAEKTPAFAWERWLRKNVIGRIPGA